MCGVVLGLVLFVLCLWCWFCNFVFCIGVVLRGVMGLCFGCCMGCLGFDWYVVLGLGLDALIVLHLICLFALDCLWVGFLFCGGFCLLCVCLYVLFWFLFIAGVGCLVGGFWMGWGLPFGGWVC